MTDMIEESFARSWRKLIDGSAIRYLMVGGTLFLVDLATFLCLKKIGTTTLIAQAISRTVGATLGFLGHKVISFRSRDYKTQLVAAQGAGYTISTVLNILISPILVAGLEYAVPGRLILVKVLAEIVMVIETYFVLRWIFRKRPVPQ